jgi:1-acyl-sn-glycerol-3-phosphate acyltransferase
VNLIWLAITACLLFVLVWLGMARLQSLGLADWGGPWLNRLNGLNRLFCRYYHRLQGTITTLPPGGPAVLVSNHHSGLDPILLIAASPRPLRFLIAEEEYNRFGLRWLFKAVGCIPVNRKERPERALRHALKMLEQGEVVALFPHGGIRLDDEPSRPLKAGAVLLARLAQCEVVPARIDGIKGLNQIILSVIRRSHARVCSGKPIRHCQQVEHKQDCLEQIKQFIETPR